MELDKTCSVCPLCHTRVVNPNQPVDHVSPKPFPSGKGTTDPVKRTDVAILASVVLAATAIVCGLLNFLAFRNSRWSLYVIGLCIVLWVFCLPVFFPGKIRSYASLLLDGVSIVMYLGIISWLHPGNNWFLKLGAPLTLVILLEVLGFVYTLWRPHRSILSTAAVFVGEISILTVIIELLVRNYMGMHFTLTWSAIVLVCGIIIDAALITILRRTGLREEVRRRMHI